MGRKSFGCGTFGMGTTVAIFQSIGKMPLSIDRLKR